MNVHSMQILIVYENLIAMTAFWVAAYLLISARIVHLIYRVELKIFFFFITSIFLATIELKVINALAT